MSTRGDFYVGQGAGAEWIGSLAHGYGSDLPEGILTAETEEDFRTIVARVVKDREDGTTPEMGWPWPWNDSRMTDYAYAFFDGKVHAATFGRGWFDPLEGEPDYEEMGNDEELPFPNMEAVKNVAWGRRSGVLIIRLPT